MEKASQAMVLLAVVWQVAGAAVATLEEAPAAADTRVRAILAVGLWAAARLAGVTQEVGMLGPGQLVAE